MQLIILYYIYEQIYNVVTVSALCDSIMCETQINHLDFWQGACLW